MLHKMIGEMPTEVGAMTYDRWTGSYRDTYNDIWVLRRHGHKLWEMAERQAGNKTVLHSRHRDLKKALVAANALHDQRRAEVRCWAA